MAILKRWIPTLIMMAVIFIFSSRPSNELPTFGIWDTLVKKGGHITGYALLSGACWYGMKHNPRKIWFAWLMAVLYALTDEFHQSFVPERHPSWMDIFVFDSVGAALGLGIAAGWIRLTPKRNRGSRTSEADH